MWFPERRNEGDRDGRVHCKERNMASWNYNEGKESKTKEYNEYVQQRGGGACGEKCRIEKENTSTSIRYYAAYVCEKACQVGSECGLLFTTTTWAAFITHNTAFLKMQCKLGMERWDEWFHVLRHVGMSDWSEMEGSKYNELTKWPCASKGSSEKRSRNMVERTNDTKRVSSVKRKREWREDKCGNGSVSG